MGAFAGAWQRLFEIRQTATAQDAAGSCTRVSHLPCRSNLPEASRQTIAVRNLLGGRGIFSSQYWLWFFVTLRLKAELKFSRVIRKEQTTAPF